MVVSNYADMGFALFAILGVLVGLGLILFVVYIGHVFWRIVKGRG